MINLEQVPAALATRVDRTLHVLLLEDSPLDAELIADRLAGITQSFELTRVDGRAGFSRALSLGRYGLILSDYNVPGFDGMSALAEARASCPQVPFLFVTGALGEERAIELMKRGATDYVLKDRLERLVPSVERALREAQEVAERRAAEERLLERERSLSTLMSNLPGMVFRCWPHEPWSFEFASEGCVLLTGWQPEDFYADGTITWASIMHPDDVPRVAQEAEQAFAERRQLTVSYRIRTKQGEVRWVWDRSVARHRPDGSIEFIEGFVTDVTLQKETEQEVQRRAEFEQQLIGIVSHDLRNPLNTITLGAAMLLKRESLDEVSTSLTRRISRSADRAARMIRDLLDFTQARFSGGIPVTCRALDLHLHAATVLDEVEHAHPTRKLKVVHEGGASGAWDPDRIAQVLVNLVGNAFTYSPAESAVTVCVRGEADHVLLDVHNHGTPIAPEQLNKLFQPFSRGSGHMDMQSRSIGLGLFIVDSIVRAHHGTIHVVSTAEAGTTFTVRLPRTGAASAPG